MYLEGKGTVKDNNEAKIKLWKSALQGYEDAIELLVKHDELFDANFTEKFYNFIMSISGRALANGDPKSSPDIALFALSSALREKGATGYTLIGVIALQLYELAMKVTDGDDWKRINYWKLAKKWALE